VQLGVRQTRFFGRIKTLFQLLLAATVANMTLVAAKTGMMGKVSHAAASFLAPLLQHAISTVGQVISMFEQFMAVIQPHKVLITGNVAQ